MLDTWPHPHLAGSFAPVGTTSTFGITPAAVAASEDSTPLRGSAMAATNAVSRTNVMRFMRKPPRCPLSGQGSRQHSPDGVGAKQGEDRAIVCRSPAGGFE